MAEPLAERRRNELLRRVDWRFLLEAEETPHARDLGGAGGEALRLVTEPAPPPPERADLVVVGYPTRARLRAAREALRPGGELVCRWSLPRPGGARRARARLEAAGFEEVRIVWPGPDPRHPPQFWLPLDCEPAIAHILERGTIGSPPRSAQKWLWRAAARLGLLFPLHALARVPSQTRPRRAAEEHPSLLLLTGGQRSINKVVGLSFAGAGSDISLVLKFARLLEVEPSLEREAEMLQLLEDERPEVPGIPRLCWRGRRAGRLVVAETATAARLMMPALSEETFGDLAVRVTDWLIDLAGHPRRRPAEDWWPRLVEPALDDFARTFGAAAPTGSGERARRALAGLGDLPQVPEHRDCSPWNIMLDDAGAPVLLDWESAEPRGLPVLDLAYFLANAVFVLERALESGRTREAYASLLDPRSAYGRVAAECFRRYSTALSIDDGDTPRLRVLCWVVHSRSDFRHLEMEHGVALNAAHLRRAVFPGLVEEELSFSRA